jgi:hypothetical protein
VSFIVDAVIWISLLSYLCYAAIWISPLLFFQADHIDKSSIFDTEPERTPTVAAVVNSSFMNCDIVKARKLQFYFWQMIWNLVHHFSSKDWWWFNLYDLHTYHVWFALDVVVLSILLVIYDCVPKLIISDYL